jgi:hypothetical protein
MKPIKFQQGFLFIDETADPYPLGLHLKKKEIIKVEGVGVISGEVFHSKGFNYKGEIVKIVGQYNLNIPNVPYIDINTFNNENK